MTSSRVAIEDLLSESKFLGLMCRIKSLLLGAFVLLVALCGVTGRVCAQEYVVPEEEDILTRTVDVESPYYLDRLLGKYLSFEEPLTDEEFFYLYYGYAYSDHYRPLEPIAAEDRVLVLVEEIMREPTQERMFALIDAASQVMERDPFSPKNLNLLAYAYGSVGDSINERKCFERMEGVIRTIERSGSGRKESSPMHVLMFSHAADVIYARGLDIKTREIISRSCEYVFLTERDSEGNLGFYFDFSRIYMVPGDYEPEPQKRGWTINNIPIN